MSDVFVRWFVQSDTHPLLELVGSDAIRAAPALQPTRAVAGILSHATSRIPTLEFARRMTMPGGEGSVHRLPSTVVDAAHAFVAKPCVGRLSRPRQDRDGRSAAAPIIRRISRSGVCGFAFSSLLRQTSRQLIGVGPARLGHRALRGEPLATARAPAPSRGASKVAAIFERSLRSNALEWRGPKATLSRIPTSLCCIESRSFHVSAAQ